jgi:hypothetical protein
MISRLFVAFLLAALSTLRAAEDLAALNAQGFAAHLKRNLGDSTPLYKQLLQLDPPRTPTAEQRALVLRFAPRLHNVPHEFFPLKDIAAIIHPEKPVIGYHLFWEDDLGFPSDNDPCDHEVVWVEYDPATLKVVRVSTYFHGRILETPAAVDEANAHGGRPWIGVEWGFHGSLPFQALPGNTPAMDTLRGHWTTAHNDKKMPRDPLARGWPEEYAASFEDYLKFTVPNDPVPQLKERDLIYVSRWVDATLNRYCLRYNFAAKLEWPWLLAK